MLDEIGFVWSLSDHKFECFLKALKIYRYNFGNLYIPQKFVIPDGDETWPINLWGARLGNLVQRTRSDSAKLDEEKRNLLKRFNPLELTK
jgi:hypothetical protein